MSRVLTSKHKPVNGAVKLNATQIARLLKASRPPDIFTNSSSRVRWYRDVSTFADALRDESTRFNATEFFDECGVPS